MFRAENIVKAANLEKLTGDQLRIMIHCDMVTNSNLKLRIQKNFDKLFAMLYQEAKTQIRIYNNQLTNEDGNKYSGKGEGRANSYKTQTHTSPP